MLPETKTLVDLLKKDLPWLSGTAEFEDIFDAVESHFAIEEKD